MTKKKTRQTPEDTVDLSGNIGRVNVPAGKVVVHNHIVPARIIGTRGFRAWLADADDTTIVLCDCKWAPELGRHYRIVRGAR